MESKDDRTELHNLIDILTEAEYAFLLTVAKGML